MTATRLEHTRRTPAIAFEHAGQGMPVLLVHGVGGNRDSWREQLAGLADDYRPVAIDVRGYGGSDDYDGPMRFEDVVDDCLRVLDALGAERCHFVGLSMGGLIGQVFLCRHPERLASAVLADTGTGTAEGRDAAWVESFLAARRKPLVEEGKTPADIAPALARTLVSPSAPPELLAQVAAILAQLRVDGYLKSLEAVARFASPPELAQVSLPVLLPVGSEDSLTPPKAAHRLAARFTAAQPQVVEIAGAGHLSNMERPAPFNTLLREFFARVEGGDSAARTPR